MSESTGERPEGDVDESAFGAGGESSHEADVDAGFDDRSADEQDTVGAGVDRDTGGGADEQVTDSHAADVDAGFDDDNADGSGSTGNAAG